MVEYIGRITVYSIVGCPHCKAAKARLKEEDLQFIDVSVDRFPPSVREWVKEKTGKTSVPQIFFNAAYIGGNKELQATLDNPEQREAALEHLKTLPGNDVPLLPNPGEALSEASEEEFEFEKDKLSDIVEKILDKNILGWNMRENFFLVKLFTYPYKMSIKGEALLSFISEQGENDTDPESIAQNLLDAKYIKKVDPGKEFRGSVEEGNEFRKCGLYKVMGKDTNDWKSLNTNDVAKYVSKSADHMAQDIRKIVLKLFASFLSDSGKTVDYKGMGQSPLFDKFKQMATQLQRVDLDKLSDDEKLAFFINIYNVLVIHATVERGGMPTNDFQRYKFFSGTSYLIGGYTLSLNDIENGILRSNRSSMATLYMKPFSSADPRMKIILPEVDPRIHFALNCGAKSCPPIKTFSGDQVQAQLNLATNAYLENDDALIVDVENNSVKLSKLFEWYEVDFGLTKTEVVEWVRDHLAEPDKKKQVEEVLSKGDFSVSYLFYDWGNNSKEEEGRN